MGKILKWFVYEEGHASSQKFLGCCEKGIFQAFVMQSSIFSDAIFMEFGEH